MPFYFYSVTVYKHSLYTKTLYLPICPLKLIFLIDDLSLIHLVLKAFLMVLSTKKIKRLTIRTIKYTNQYPLIEGYHKFPKCILLLIASK